MLRLGSSHSSTAADLPSQYPHNQPTTEGTQSRSRFVRALSLAQFQGAKSCRDSEALGTRLPRRNRFSNMKRNGKQSMKLSSPKPPTASCGSPSEFLGSLGFAVSNGRRNRSASAQHSIRHSSRWFAGTWIVCNSYHPNHEPIFLMNRYINIVFFSSAHISNKYIVYKASRWITTANTFRENICWTQTTRFLHSNVWMWLKFDLCLNIILISIPVRMIPSLIQCIRRLSQLRNPETNRIWVLPRRK